MNLKTKRKTKIAILSIAFMCLFVLSFSLGTQAADDLVYDEVSFDSKIEVQELPIVVSVKFIWGTGASVQKLDYVWLDYDTQKGIIEGKYRVTYDCFAEGIDLRPTLVLMTIPEGNLDEGDTIYFKISYQWDKFGEQNMIVRPDEVHKVEILHEGAIEEEAEQNLIIYIVLGSAGAVVLIALSVMYTIRRRR